ncbi:Uncharacterised protein [Lysinibacillus capsici]|uniref:Uncharacterized protein n=1 Tax=Lysinibacillus capsici TaxID=2115968 RepID=A0A2X0XZ12_9BACI|nr:hypothetical protein [Lysinibacillus capsici]SPT95560.1 Uncharacterised protein [Lysinibacillus capsici]
MTSKIENEKASPKQVGDAIKKASVETNADVLIYVGPTTKQLTQYATFIGGKPDHMKEHFDKCKVLEKLFIPTKEFESFEKQLADGNSVESMLFKKVKEYFQNEVK